MKKPIKKAKPKKRKAFIALERRTRHLRKFLGGVKVKKRKSKRAKLGSRTPRQMSAF